MQDSQILSPILKLVRKRWDCEGRTGTIVSDDYNSVIGPSGERADWLSILDQVLASRNDDGEIPVHQSIEVFQTNLYGQQCCAVRAKAGAVIERDTFLGFYQGWVGTSDEGLLLPVGRSEGSPDAGTSCCTCPRSGTMCSRMVQTLKVHSYLVKIAEIACSPTNKKVVVVSAIDHNGNFVGNALGRINDGRNDPLSKRNHADLPTAANDQDEKATLLEHQPSHRPPNTAFVQIVHNGWLYLGVIATCKIEGGQELLLDYSAGYWEQQRALHSDISRLSRISTKPRMIFTLSGIGNWLRDASFLFSIWSRQRQEDAALFRVRLHFSRETARLKQCLKKMNRNSHNRYLRNPLMVGQKNF